jgi:glutathione S-transferase
MITLYTFGPKFGLPDPSPFVTKAEVLLKLAGLPYEIDTTGYRKAPKGKLPYIRDGESLIADSTFIRLHLERQHGIDFDTGLSPAERARGWAFEKMCDEHLYWAIVQERWNVDENFNRGPRQFFDPAPAPIRPLVIAMIKRKVKRDMHGHGIGRHTHDEIVALGCRDIDAIAHGLGDKPWFSGSDPHGADAAIWPFVNNALCPHFTSKVGDRARTHANLVSYADRGLKTWFPHLAAGVG